MFQPLGSPGSAGAASGTRHAAASPAKAITTPRPETICAPDPSMISAPPRMVPSRMPRNVPASISPLPATSSPSPRWVGRMAYLSGEKNVACRPNPNSTANSAGRLPVRKPAVAASISSTSHSLVSRISRDFSPRSAICPAVAEKNR